MQGLGLGVSFCSFSIIVKKSKVKWVKSHLEYISVNDNDGSLPNPLHGSSAFLLSLGPDSNSRASRKSQMRFASDYRAEHCQMPAAGDSDTIGAKSSKREMKAACCWSWPTPTSWLQLHVDPLLTLYDFYIFLHQSFSIILGFTRQTIRNSNILICRNSLDTRPVSESPERWGSSRLCNACMKFISLKHKLLNNCWCFTQPCLMFSSGASFCS